MAYKMWNKDEDYDKKRMKRLMLDEQAGRGKEEVK